MVSHLSIIAVLSFSDFEILISRIHFFNPRQQHETHLEYVPLINLVEIIFMATAIRSLFILMCSTIHCTLCHLYEFASSSGFLDD